MKTGLSVHQLVYAIKRDKEKGYQSSD